MRDFHVRSKMWRTWCKYKQDYRDIFALSDDRNNPRHLDICRQHIVFRHFPMQKLLENPGTWSINTYKYGELMAADLHKVDWIYIIKSGEARVLKYVETNSSDVRGRRRRVQALLNQQCPFHRKRQLLNFMEDRHRIRSSYQAQSYRPCASRSQPRLRSAPPPPSSSSRIRPHSTPLLPSRAKLSLSTSTCTPTLEPKHVLSPKTTSARAPGQHHVTLPRLPPSNHHDPTTSGPHQGPGVTRDTKVKVMVKDAGVHEKPETPVTVVSERVERLPDGPLSARSQPASYSRDGRVVGEGDRQAVSERDGQEVGGAGRSDRGAHVEEEEEEEAQPSGGLPDSSRHAQDTPPPGGGEPHAPATADCDETAPGNETTVDGEAVEGLLRAEGEGGEGVVVAGEGGRGSAPSTTSGGPVRRVTDDGQGTSAAEVVAVVAEEGAPPRTRGRSDWQQSALPPPPPGQGQGQGQGQGRGQAASRGGGGGGGGRGNGGVVVVEGLQLGRHSLPGFVQVETLHPGQAFGLRACLEPEERGPSVSLVSGDCEVLQINKKFFMGHCDEAIYSLIRLKSKPFPSQEELIDRLDVNLQWEEFKQHSLHSVLTQQCRSSR
ncbi:uncharacterized protein LOC143298924 isoform X2 [Babylonia areolata]|uniref:uncharacterized protein LOC143298924 isoform X2 n=1 Tax=Babylonia areolata TaxID=304850 RepID=UPI003FD15407